MRKRKSSLRFEKKSQQGAGMVKGFSKWIDK
jgi:hypothetical protein